jgi:hypothetical protein
VRVVERRTPPRRVDVPRRALRPRRGDPAAGRPIGTRGQGPGPAATGGPVVAGRSRVGRSRVGRRRVARSPVDRVVVDPDRDDRSVRDLQVGRWGGAAGRTRPDAGRTGAGRTGHRGMAVEARWGDRRAVGCLARGRPAATRVAPADGRPLEDPRTAHRAAVRSHEDRTVAVRTSQIRLGGVLPGDPTAARHPSHPSRRRGMDRGLLASRNCVPAPVPHRPATTAAARASRPGLPDPGLRQRAVGSRTRAADRNSARPPGRPS